MAPRQHVGFYINVQAPPMRITDKETGRFLSVAQTQLYQQNREIAIDLQGEIGRRIENSLQRPKVSSHRLVRVTGDAKNISPANRYFMGVGNVKFLDKSIAKYWRTVEEGTAATWNKRSFTSLPLRGLWGTNVASWRGSIENPWIGLGGKTERAAPISGPGGVKKGQEMFHPFNLPQLPVFYPKADTTPMHAYKAVAENPDTTARNLRVAANFWNMVLGRGFRPGDAPFD